MPQAATLYIIIMPIGFAEWGGLGDGLHSWAHHSTHFYTLLPAEVNAGLLVELLLFAYVLGRAVEELQQVYIDRGAYFRDSWNLLDVTTVSLMLVCFVIRVVVWYDGIDATRAMPRGALMSTELSLGRLDLDGETILTLMQVPGHARIATGCDARIPTDGDGWPTSLHADGLPHCMLMASFIACRRMAMDGRWPETAAHDAARRPRLSRERHVSATERLPPPPPLSGARPQLVQCGFAISTICVFVRFWDNLSVFPAVGELTTILYYMFTGSAPLLGMIFWSAIGFGAAFAGLVPIGASDPRYFSRPFWCAARRVILGTTAPHRRGTQALCHC